MAFALLICAIFAILGLVKGQCNPLQESCSPIKGLVKEYSLDFTKQTSLPEGWVLANYAIVKYGPNGAEFSVNQRKQAPYMWTNFYIHYGRVEVVMQAAPGTGVISSAVLMSDTHDEIDWEWSGNNFGDSNPKVQTNYFGKGITGWYDRGTTPAVNWPQYQFHTYTFDWTPTELKWGIDGQTVRTHYARDSDLDTHQYPQTPSKFHLGVWCGGDTDNHPETVKWAGGVTDFTKVPFTAFVKSVKITNYNPCSKYEYLDRSGNVGSVKCINETITSTSSSSSTSTSTSRSSSFSSSSSSSSSSGSSGSTSSSTLRSTSSVSSSPSSTTGSSTSSTLTRATSTSTSKRTSTSTSSPTSTTTSRTTTSSPTSTTTLATCTIDSCLQALISPFRTASPAPSNICSTLTARAISTNAAYSTSIIRSLSTWLPRCTPTLSRDARGSREVGRLERARSACSCYAAGTTTKSTTSTTSTTTIKSTSAGLPPVRYDINGRPITGRQKRGMDGDGLVSDGGPAAPEPGATPEVEVEAEVGRRGWGFGLLRGGRWLE